MNVSEFRVSFNQDDEAISIMREAAQWLIETGKPLWAIENLTKDKLVKGQEDFLVGWIGNESAASMILQWHDSFFWPNAKENESGFIHKLSVRRKFAGSGISEKMIKFAIDECKKRKISYLRLDCAGDREKLCSYYERIGFKQVAHKMIGKYDVALYELAI